MAFTKSFPKRSDKSVYPKWDEVALTEEEERQAEEDCRQENIRLMQECIKDAKVIISSGNLKDYQTDLVNMAISLFEKRASHSIYWKENMAKDKFYEMEKEQR